MHYSIDEYKMYITQKDITKVIKANKFFQETIKPDIQKYLK